MGEEKVCFYKYIGQKEKPYLQSSASLLIGEVAKRERERTKNKCKPSGNYETRLWVVGQTELEIQELGDDSEQHTDGLSLSSPSQHGESDLCRFIISSDSRSPCLKQKTGVSCLAWELYSHEPQIRPQLPDTQCSGIIF